MLSAYKTTPNQPFQLTLYCHNCMMINIPVKLAFLEANYGDVDHTGIKAKQVVSYATISCTENLYRKAILYVCKLHLL